MIGKIACLKEKEMMVNLSEYFEQYRFEPITTYTVNKIKHDLNEIIPDYVKKPYQIKEVITGLL